MNEEYVRTNLPGMIAGMNRLVTAKQADMYVLQRLDGADESGLMELKRQIIERLTGIRAVIAKLLYTGIYRESWFAPLEQETMELYGLEKQAYDMMVLRADR